PGEPLWLPSHRVERDDHDYVPSDVDELADDLSASPLRTLLGGPNSLAKRDTQS
ncbi:MAG: hypothetical protein CYPHOPRED_003161, partial [Cyphobasidiales sp. Tagirdzhanova-0007]